MISTVFSHQAPRLLASWAALSLGLGAIGCGSGKGELDGDGDGGAVITDARMISNVFTWGCQEGDSGPTYQGVYGQTMSLEYAPGSLRSLALPAPGECTFGLDMFPTDAGPAGAALPGVSGGPRWVTDSDEGVMNLTGAGFYFDDVFPNSRTCLQVEGVIGSGAELQDAGPLTGGTSPPASAAPDVEFIGLRIDSDTGAQVLDWGADIDLRWDDHAWDNVWVQIRREREGTAWESVTCNATGRSTFAVGEQVWGLLNQDLPVEQNNLYVTFENSAQSEMDDGTTLQSVTRSVAVALVGD